MNNLIIPRDFTELRRDEDNLDFHARKVEFYEEVNNKNMADRHQWALDIYTDLEAAHIRLQEAEEAMMRGYRY